MVSRARDDRYRQRAQTRTTGVPPSPGASRETSRMRPLASRVSGRRTAIDRWNLRSRQRRWLFQEPGQTGQIPRWGNCQKRGLRRPRRAQWTLDAVGQVRPVAPSIERSPYPLDCTKPKIAGSARVQSCGRLVSCRRRSRKCGAPNWTSSTGDATLFALAGWRPKFRRLQASQLHLRCLGRLSWQVWHVVDQVGDKGHTQAGAELFRMGDRRSLVMMGRA